MEVVSNILLNVLLKLPSTAMLSGHEVITYLEKSVRKIILIYPGGRRLATSGSRPDSGVASEGAAGFNTGYGNKLQGVARLV